MNEKRKKRPVKETLRAIQTGAAFGGAVLDLWTAIQNHPAWYLMFADSSLINANFGERESLNQPPKMSLVWGSALKHQVDAGDVGKSLASKAVASDHPKTPDAVIDLWIHAPIMHSDYETVEENDPLTEAATIMLNQLRSVATTTVAYDIEDFKRYLNACQVATAWYAMIRRELGLIDITDAYDADAPRKYALMGLPIPGIKMDDIRNDLPYVKSLMSTSTGVLRTLLPMNVTLLERTKWLMANVFKDAPSVKFSTKMFRAAVMEYEDTNGVLHIYGTLHPDSIKKIDASNVVQGADQTISTVMFTGFKQMVTEFNKFLNLIMQDDMTSRIVGDLLKAFGDKIFMPIPDYLGGRAPFVYDEDILNQIQNSTPVLSGGLVTNTMIAVRSAVGSPHRLHAILVPHSNANWADGDYFSDAYVNQTAFIKDGLMINTFRDSVDPGRVLALTRLQHFTTAVPLNRGNGYSVMMLEPICAGTEHVLSYSYAVAMNEQDGGWLTIGISQDLEYASHWASDDYAPYWSSANNANGARAWRPALFDRQNWAIIGRSQLAAYHEVAALSLYTIPFLVDKQTMFNFRT